MPKKTPALPSRVDALRALLDDVLGEDARSNAFWQRYADATGQPLWLTDYGLSDEPETDPDDEDGPPSPDFTPDPKRAYVEDALPALVAACKAQGEALVALTREAHELLPDSMSQSIVAFAVRREEDRDDDPAIVRAMRQARFAARAADVALAATRP